MGLAWDLWGGHGRIGRWNGMGLMGYEKSHPTHRGQGGTKIHNQQIVMKKVYSVLPLSVISGGSSSGM